MFVLNKDIIVFKFVCNKMLEPSTLSKIDEFRTQVADLNLKDEYSTTAFLYPFLRAQQMDTHKARIMLENAVNWRSEYDGILEWEIPTGLHEILPYEILGQDPEGRPVLYAQFGQWDMKKAIKDFGREIFLKYCFQMSFKLEDMAKTTCINEIPSSINIYNFDGIRMGQLTSSAVISASLENTKVVNEYFPGLYHANIQIRMSRFAEMFVKLLRPFFSEEFTESLQTYGSDANKYKPELLKYLPINQIPKEIGGLKS